MVLRRLLVPFVLFLLIAGMAALFLPAMQPQAQGYYAEEQAFGLSDQEHVATELQQEQAYADCRRPVEPDTATRLIAVSVATLWKEPGVARAKDASSLTSPVQLNDWLQPLSVKDKLWFVGKLETQVLLGTEVQVIEERGDWVKVVVPEQQTPLNEVGYPGWLPVAQLSEKSVSYEACDQAMVTKPTASLYHSLDSSTSSVMGVSFATQLPVIIEQDEWLSVDTPAGSFWVETDAVRRAEMQSVVRGEQLVETGKQFLDLPYLWAGTSGFGFDCSGFTYSLHRFHGISIPRDAKDQAVAGVEVPRDELQPGDLLFFAYGKGKGKVHHVAMYIGNGQMIHSPRTERSVEIIDLSTPEYAAEYAGARRYY